MWENEKEVMGMSTVFSKVHQAPVMEGALLQSTHEERPIQMRSLRQKVLPQPKLYRTQEGTS